MVSTLTGPHNVYTSAQVLQADLSAKVSDFAAKEVALSDVAKRAEERNRRILGSLESVQCARSAEQVVPGLAIDSIAFRHVVPGLAMDSIAFRHVGPGLDAGTSARISAHTATRCLMTWRGSCRRCAEGRR